MNDLYLTHEGDLLLDQNGYPTQVLGTAALRQEVAIRIKTTPGSSELYPEIGAQLQRLVGQLLTPETLSTGENIIRAALVNSNTVGIASVVVRGVPVNRTQAIFVIQVTPTDRQPIMYPVPFDFARGIVTERLPGAVGTDPTA